MSSACRQARADFRIVFRLACPTAVLVAFRGQISKLSLPHRTLLSEGKTKQQFHGIRMKRKIISSISPATIAIVLFCAVAIVAPTNTTNTKSGIESPHQVSLFRISPVPSYTMTANHNNVGVP
jgi:undecaprenyl pyrophosphate phosphatase UppP